MVKDSKNNIWFGFHSGLIAKHDAAADKFIIYKNVFQNRLSEVSPVDGLCVDKTDHIWWSPGDNGIREFDAKKEAVIDSALFPLHISSPSFINDSVLIGGSAGKGFFMYNKFTKAVMFFNAANGLSSNDVFGGVPYTSQQVWVFANDGIELLNLTDRKVSKYSANEGIKDYELQGAFYKLKNGTIMFASKSGIIYFNPKDIKTKPEPPDVLITGFSAAQKNLSVDSLLQNKCISLSYNQN